MKNQTIKPILLAATTAAALAFGPAVVLAQSAHDQAPSIKNPAIQTTHNKQGMRAQIRDMLQNAGFTDIHLMPGSFVIHAKDKDGNPVVMNVSPDSFTEMTEVVGDNSDESAGQTGSSSSSRFVSVPGADELSSNVVGLDVYNNDNKNIGQIKELSVKNVSER